MNIKISIEHDRKQIPLVGKLISRMCVLVDIAHHPKVNKIEVAVVELLNNIINYTSCEHRDPLIEIHCKFFGKEFEVVVTDLGDRLAASIVEEYTNGTVNMPVLDMGVVDLPESGWGIQLIKSACDNLSYNRVEKKNVYKLTFDLSSTVV